jgi:hypothetical protein
VYPFSQSGGVSLLDNAHDSLLLVQGVMPGLDFFSHSRQLLKRLPAVLICSQLFLMGRVNSDVL